MLPKTALKHEWASAAAYNTSILLEIYRTSVNAVSNNFREHLEIKIDAVQSLQTNEFFIEIFRLVLKEMLLDIFITGEEK